MERKEYLNQVHQSLNESTGRAWMGLISETIQAMASEIADAKDVNELLRIQGAMRTLRDLQSEVRRGPVRKVG